MAIMAVAALASLMLGSRAWSGARKSLSRSFSLFESSVFVWCLFSFVEWAIPDPAGQYEALRLQYYGIAFMPGASFLFARALASRPVRFPRAALPFVPGLLFSIVIATNGSHRVFWTEVLVGPAWVEPPYGWAYWLFVAYGYSMIAASIAIIALAARRAKGVYARWLWLIMGFFLLPFAANVVYIAAISGRTGYDITPIAFAASGFLMAYIMKRFDVFDPLPYAKSVILESIDTPMLVVDAEDYVVGANDEARKVFARLGALEGRHFSALVPSYGPSMGDRDTMRWSPGGVDYLIACYVIQRDRADWQGRLILFRDITELTRATRELEAARAKAEAASASKSGFVAVVSHELRNPLGTIIGIADLNLRRDLTTGLRDDFEMIRSSGRLLLGIVNDLLDISKMEAGKLELESADFDLVERAMSVARAYWPVAAAKGIDLRTTVEDGAPRFVRGDPQRFEQVLMNLLGNAVKFTERGGVRVRIAPLPGDPGSADPRTAGALVEVHDTGIGISPAGRERLFKDFSQADKSIATRFGGTGLGLSVCKRIVDLMGGEIRVESEEGSGSSFSFTARFEPGDPERARSVVEGAPKAGRALRVLVVDDDPASAQVASRYAEGLGHQVSCASTGAEGIASLLAGGFDLALVDIGLQDMNGLDVVRRVRAEQARLASRPVVMAAMTASAEPDLFSRCESAGVDDLLPKPLDPERLGRLLIRVSGDRRGSPRRSPSSPTPPPKGRKYRLIDEEALLSHMGGDEAFMKRILGIFIKEAPTRVEAIDAAVASRDLEALRRAVHGLHGSCLTLRAEPLGVVTASMEAGLIEAMRSTGFDGFDAHAESLKALLERTVTAARDLVGG
jgi:signal transduction histidine kinase/HPt (histidine-containing phosphotransfer) domain-containing protein/ActR/RegA family two-component response regulator